MKFELALALRYLRSPNQGRFVTFLSVVSFLGIFVSVLSFLIIHSVMNGFSTHVKKSLVSFNSHIRLEISDLDEKQLAQAKLEKMVSSGELENFEEIQDLSGIFETDLDEAHGVKIRGMNFSELDSKDGLKVTHFYPPQSDDEGSIYVGSELYQRLQFIPGQDERGRLVYPFGDVGPTGEIEPRTKSFVVSGVVNTGFYDYDSHTVFISLKEASLLSAFDNSRRVYLIRLKDQFNLDGPTSSLSHLFPKSKIQTWKEQNRRLFSALKLERIGMFVLLSIVTLIACMNILGLVSLMVLSKTREMAVLKALGASTGQIATLFQWVGGLLGLCGTVFGLGAGLAVISYLKVHPLPLPPAYYLDVLPVKVDPWVIAVLLVMAPGFSVLAGVLPSYLAGKLNPVDLLKGS